MAVIPLDLAPSELTIRIDPGAVAASSPEIGVSLDARWAQMCAANPRLFNGPILQYLAYDPVTRSIAARVSDFKHLAVPAAYPDDGLPPTTILSVSGVVTYHDAHGITRVCLGRRSHQTRVYGGMWELAPSGGINAPDSPAVHEASRHNGSLAVESLRQELKEELGERSGVKLSDHTPRIIGLVLDELSGSMDVHVHLKLDGPIETGHGVGGWEYDRVQSLSLGEIARLIESEPCIPPLLEIHKTECFTRLFA